MALRSAENSEIQALYDQSDSKREGPTRQDTWTLAAHVQNLSDRDACVVVIADDREFLESVARLLRSTGLRSRLFGSTAEFLRAEALHGPTCLVLDVSSLGYIGLDFQHKLSETGSKAPIIFVSGHADVSMVVRAMKGGAVDFLTKPIREQDLREAAHIALARDRARRADEAALSEIRVRFESLTPRERAILIEVAKGRLNKQIAAEMGITEPTVKSHRSNMMRKFKPGSLAELCRMVDRLVARAETSYMSQARC